MRRQKRLIVLLAVLAVCIGGAVILSRIDFEEKMTGTQTEIVNVDSSEITYLSWNYEDETVAFSYSDDQWSCDDDSQMPVDQELMAEIAESLSQITSDKRVEDVKNLGIYGLDDPQYTITIGADQTYEIAIGDESFTDGEVYISTGDDYVYLTDAGLIDKISYSLYDLVEKAEIPEMASVDEITVDKENGVDIVYQENAGYCYSDAYTYYLKDGDNYTQLDNENTEDMISTLSTFSWGDCVNYNVQDSELADYGLDEPTASVRIQYKDEDGNTHEFAYDVGTADDQYYAKAKDSAVVCMIDESVFNAADTASYDELKPEEVILLDWDTVDSMDIEMDGSIYSVSISPNEDASSEEEDSEEPAYIYTLNGSEIDFSDAVDELTGMTLDPDETAQIGENKEELSMTFRRNTENYDTVALTFYQYNGTYCIAVLDGEVLGCTARDDVVALKEAVNTVILDQSPDSDE